MKTVAFAGEAECSEEQDQAYAYETIYYFSFAAYATNTIVMSVILTLLLIKKAQWIAYCITIGYLLANLARTISYGQVWGNGMKEITVSSLFQKAAKLTDTFRSTITTAKAWSSIRLWIYSRLAGASTQMRSSTRCVIGRLQASSCSLRSGSATCLRSRRSQVNTGRKFQLISSQAWRI